MDLKRGRFINFLSYRDEVVDLTGIIAACIQGPNGSGKSSLIDAVLYALTGECPRGRDVDGTDARLIRRGETDMTDIIEFEVAGMDYQIVRKLSLGNGKVKRVVELKQLATDALAPVWNTIATGTAAKKKILEVIGRNYNTITSSAFLMQGQGEKIINAKPSDRRKVLMDILGLEKYGDLKKDVASMRREQERDKKSLAIHYHEMIAVVSGRPELEWLRGETVEDLERLRRYLADIEVGFSARTGRKAVLESRLADATDLKAKIAVAIKQKDGLVVKKEDLEKRLPVLTPEAEEILSMYSGINGLQTAITTLADLEAKRKTLTGIDEQIAPLNERIAVLGQNIRSNEPHVVRCRKILDNKEKILKCLEDEKMLKVKLEELRSAVETEQASVKTINESLQKAASIETKCVKLRGDIYSKERVMDKSLEAKKRELAKARELAKSLDGVTCKGEGEFSMCPLIAQAVKARDSIAVISAEIEELQKPLDLPEKESLERHKAELLALNVDRLTSQRAESERKIGDAQQDTAKATDRLRLLATWTENASKIDTAQVEYERIQSQIEADGKEIGLLECSVNDLTAKKASLVSLAAEITLLGSVVERLKAPGEIEELQTAILTAQRGIDDLTGKAKAFNGLEDELKSLAVLMEIARKEIDAAKDSEGVILGEISRLDADIRLCIESAKKGEQLELCIRDAEHKILVYTELEEAYELIPVAIMDMVIPIIEDEGNEVLKEISDGMRIEFVTPVDAPQDLNIIVYDDMGESPIEMYSGGEKTRQVLAISVGYAEIGAKKAASKFESFVLDEPAGLDRQGLMDFARYFQQLAHSGMFKKALLVVHDEKTKDAFEQKILVEKEGRQSRVTVVV